MSHRSALKFALLASLATAAHAQEYFPLEPGNVWVYKASGVRATNPLVIEVVRAQEFEGRRYSLLRWPGKGEYWLRYTPNGMVTEYDPRTQEEKVWYRFNAAPGEIYTTALPSCCGRASIATTAAKYKGVLGEHAALEMTYPGVFQVGIDREQFIPHVGMVHRIENTGGPSVANYDLSYARINGVTVISELNLNVSLALDRRVYPPDGRLQARFTVRNSASPAIALQFPSSQIYNLAIRNQAGAVVYNWAADKLFAAIVQTIDFGMREYHIQAPLPNLPPGLYTVEAWLTTTSFPEKAYLARVAFEVAR